MTNYQEREEKALDIKIILAEIFPNNSVAQPTFKNLIRGGFGSPRDLQKSKQTNKTLSAQVSVTVAL